MLTLSHSRVATSPERRPRSVSSTTSAPALGRHRPARCTPQRHGCPFPARVVADPQVRKRHGRPQVDTDPAGHVGRIRSFDHGRSAPLATGRTADPTPPTGTATPETRPGPVARRWNTIGAPSGWRWRTHSRVVPAAATARMTSSSEAVSEPPTRGDHVGARHERRIALAQAEEVLRAVDPSALEVPRERAEPEQLLQHGRVTDPFFVALHGSPVAT